MLVSYRIVSIAVFLLLFCNLTFAKNLNGKKLATLEEISSELDNISENIKKLEKEFSKKGLTSKDKIELQKKKNLLVSRKWNLKLLQKRAFYKKRLQYTSSSHPMKLIVTPSKVCESPCQVTVEAIPDKIIKNKIKNYYFFIDEKRIESSTPKIETTLVFNKNSFAPAHLRKIKDKVDIVKKFQVHAEGIISEYKFIKSQRKFVAVKSASPINTSVELLTTTARALDKIIISVGENTGEVLSAKIDNLDVVFKKDTAAPNTMFTTLPYINKDRVLLSIGDKEFPVKILPLENVEMPRDFLAQNISKMAELLDLYITDKDYAANLGKDGVQGFSYLKEALNLINGYIAAQASEEKVQLAANLLNQSFKNDSDLFQLYTYQHTSGQSSTIVSNQYKKIHGLGKMFQFFSHFIIANANANSQEDQALFIVEFQKLLEKIVNLGSKTLYDGMIHKCYISKGRVVPIDVQAAEMILSFWSQSSWLAMAIDPINGALSYLGSIAGSVALITRINYDCEGDTLIKPKLIIYNQPTLPLRPGNSLSYNLKCDVGDSRYYEAGSILTKVTSRLNYSIPVLEPEGKLVSNDKTVKRCVGLGQDYLDTDHDVSCSTNALKETQYYLNNRNNYEKFNKSLCKGAPSYYVGIYETTTPLLSCDFVNEGEKVNISSPIIKGNDVVIDLTKTWNCPKASFTYSVNNFSVTFNANDNFNQDIKNLTYKWDFGDGQLTETSSPLVVHKYHEAKKYTVKLIISDPFGANDEITQTIEIHPLEFSFFLKVDPTGTYLPAYFSSATRLNLQSIPGNPNINLQAGDIIYIQGLGNYQTEPAEYGGTDTHAWMIGVFASNGKFYFPGEDSIYESIESSPTFIGHLPTDIPEDFYIPFDGYVKLQVPEGATEILFTADDNLFTDNSDPNYDFGVKIKIQVRRYQQN
ncbi:hypothetical protein C0V70_00045 [Bacteriovorax stolpii]|uniref:Uncharacterized protein n=1 Tax=Bacteriovorax stolpii TaxID=960 RepID=A0A2K9NLY6_BACTC|nr:PKD domain-containing protein [Bacteriovorax stolpii]AUN96521.1 hypothetical protein C0V70_00045 [Bacteriovorax stolpii]TDP53958.1 PKD domain-containing protein [Bacteriovorax stolpii]